MENKNIDRKSNFAQDIKQLIADSRQRIATSVNAEISILNWKIGKRIKTEILGDRRAEYGKSVIKNLSETLTAEYGTEWSEKQLQHCLHLVEVFPDSAIFSALRRELTWTHIKHIMYLDDSLKREFYIEMCNSKIGVPVHYRSVLSRCFTNERQSAKKPKTP